MQRIELKLKGLTQLNIRISPYLFLVIEDLSFEAMLNCNLL